MSFAFKKGGLNEFTEYLVEDTGGEDLTEAANLAQKWGHWTLRFARQYSSVVEESLLDGLIMAQGLNQGENPEGKELQHDFTTVMRAADILSRFWEYSPAFVRWQNDEPYQNGYGNWIDPVTRRVIEEHEAISIGRSRA